MTNAALLPAASAEDAWTFAFEKAIEPFEVAQAIGIGRTMTLHDLCVAIGILSCGNNYDRIRCIIPRADQGRVATALKGVPVYLWCIMDQRTGTPNEAVRCIEVP
jgi:hypothetical protein